jgi:membrane protease YdiL (CAAX protease family)
MSTPPVGPERPPLELPELPAGAPRPEPAGTRPDWPLWMAPVALLAALAVAIVGAIVVGIIARVAGADLTGEDAPPGVLIGGTFIQDFALIGSAFVFARLVAAPLPWHFGLRPTRFWPGVGWTVLAWLAFIALSAIWAAALGIDETEDLPQELGADESSVALVFTALLVCVAAPLAEEIFFRGFFYRVLRGWRGPLIAAVLTGAVFGLIHAGSSPAEFLVPLAIFGIVLCLLYERTGSLYPCIVLHAINNCLALGVSLDWTAGEVIALMAGANLLIAALLSPFARRDAAVPAGP